MRVAIRPSRAATLAVTLQGVAFLYIAGCSRQWYREDADEEAYAVLAETATGTPWQLPVDFAIDPDRRSRLYDPSDPDDPTLPAPGEILHYLVRAAAPNVGSWGQDSAGVERDPACD